MSYIDESRLRMIHVTAKRPKPARPKRATEMNFFYGKWISFTGNGFLFRFMKSEISRFAIASPDSTLVFRFTLS